MGFSVPLCRGVSACLSGGFLIRKTGVISVVARFLEDLLLATTTPGHCPAYSRPDAQPA